MVRPELWQLCT